MENPSTKELCAFQLVARLGLEEGCGHTITQSHGKAALLLGIGLSVTMLPVLLRYPLGEHRGQQVTCDQDELGQSNSLFAQDHDANLKNTNIPSSCH